jgi:hypothetical protein
MNGILDLDRPRGLAAASEIDGVAAACAARRSRKG